MPFLVCCIEACLLHSLLAGVVVQISVRECQDPQDPRPKVVSALPSYYQWIA